MWNGYILYEKHNTLTDNEWQLCLTALDVVLNDFPNHAFPNFRLHSRLSLSGEKIIYEAHFAEDKLNKGRLNSAIVAYVIDVLGESISIGTVNRNFLTVFELGDKWIVSNRTAVQYLRDNIDEWELAEE